MPYALSHTGALVGLATMLLVALCNDFTSMLMVNNAYETGLDSYESLALWAGGPKWKVRGSTLAAVGFGAKARKQRHPWQYSRGRLQ
jgi:amino acid permease